MTSSVRVVKTEAHHYALLSVGVRHSGEVPNASNLQALTIMRGEEVLAIIGGSFLLPGVLQAWSFISDKVTTCGLSFYRKVQQICKIYINEPDIHRIQFSVRRGYMDGWKFAHSLGFSCEGVMSSYGGIGNDYWLFARVKDVRS